MSKMWETKQRILESIGRKSKTLTDLSSELGLAPSTIAEHIQDLLSINAIREIDDSHRKWRYYEINPAYAVQVQQENFIRRSGLALGGILVLALVVIGYLYLSAAQQVLSCSASSVFACGKAATTSSGTLSLQIGGLNSSVYIKGVGCSYNTSQPSYFAPVNENLSSGAFASLNITCPASVRPVSAKVVYIWLNYVTGGQGTIARVATITLPSTAAQQNT